MRKVAIYGGSFNPVHFGHIGLARWVLEHTDTDEVWLMVSPNNPLKDSSMLADEQERLESVKRAIEADEKVRGRIEGKRLRACDWEFKMPRPSYTVDTLRALMEAYQDVEFRLLIGEDNWEIFDKWKEWEWILEKVEVWVYPRRCTKERCTKDDVRCTKEEVRRTMDDGRCTKERCTMYDLFTKEDVRCTKEDGRCTKDDGRWTKDDGRWTKDDGRWTKDDGRWTKDDGRRIKGVKMLEGAPYFDISSTEIREKQKK